MFVATIAGCAWIVVAAVRRQLPVWAAVAALLGIVAVHGFIIGLPARFGEMMFARSLHAGMRRAEVIRMERRLGGRDTSPPWLDEQITGAPGVVDVTFLDTAFIWGSGGKVFHLTFDSAWRLAAWSEDSVNVSL